MSRDVFSKNKEKRPRTSSGESNNSFVKNVTSRVSGYLPATITKWFSSPRATANGSAPAADATDSSTEDEAPESPVTVQPPAKRMRYNTTGTETNCVTSNIETIDISPSYSFSSPPGRSTFRRETNFASTPIRSPEESVIERADKETMFPQHTVSSSGSNLAKKRKSLFGNQSQEISEVSKKACVKTANNVVRDPRQPCFKPTLLGSPFYAGRTTYGGAASSYINQPNITQRQTTTVREAASNTDNNISHSARRVLELLESYSSPLAEAKRIPQYNRPTRQEIAKRMSDSSLASPYRKSISYKTQELHVPRIASILRLKQRSRLNDTTNAARQLIASHSSSSPDYFTQPYGTKSDQTETETSNKLTTKVKSRLTRPPRGESNALDTETVTPLDLPKAVLQIDPNNLPNFNTPVQPKTTSTDKLIANKTELKIKPVETISKPENIKSNSVYNFSNPVRITSESPKTTSTPPKFTFGSPERSIETLPAPKEPEPLKPLIVTKEVEKKNTEPKPWQCPDCWVSNKADVDKCVCCGYNNAPKPAKKSKCTLCKLADSQDNSEKCVNCDKVQVNNIAKPLKADTSKWQCKDCWVDNKDTADKCVCCGAKNPKATQTTPANKPKVGAMCSKCFASMTLGKCTKCESNIKPTNSLEAVIKSQAEKWECEHCLVRNETTKSKCACCGADRSGHVEKNPEKNKFNFGTGIPNFKFGIDLKVQEASLAKATQAAAEKKDKVEESETNNNVLAKAPTFSFGVPAKKPEDETDSVKEKKEEAPKPTFSFGLPKQNSIAPSTPAQMFSFTSKVADAPKTDAEVKEKPQEEKKPEEAPKPIIFGATPASTSTTTASQPAVPAFTLDSKIAPSNPLSLPATSAEAAPTLSLSASKPAMGLFTPPTSITFNAVPTPASGGLFQKTDDASKPLSIFQKSESPVSVPTSAATSLFQKPEASAPSPAPSAAPAPAPAPAPAAATMFNFGTAPAAPPADKPKFNFTFGAPKTDNVFKPPTFGAPADNAPKFTLGSAAPENPLAANPLSSGTSLTGNSLSGSNSLPVNSLGATNALPTNNLQATPSIFGSPVQKPESVQNPMWSTPASSAPNPFNAANNVAKPFSFGSSTPFSSATPAFGAATTQAPAFGAATTQAPAFGAATTQAPAFGAATTQAPAFGAATTQAPATAAFGGASQTPAAFGSPATPAFGAAASTPAPTFGAGAQSAPNIFGMPNQNQNNQGGMFSSGGQSAPMFGSPQPAGGVFGRPAAPTFGSPGASLPGFEAPALTPAPAPSFNFTQPTTGVFGFGQQQAQGGSQTGVGVYNFGGAPAQGPVQFNMGAPGAAVRRVRKAVRRR